MPPIMDLDIIADMGRMNGALALEDATGSLREPIQERRPWLAL
jgi:hypothetical protein